MTVDKEVWEAIQQSRISSNLLAWWTSDKVLFGINVQVLLYASLEKASIPAVTITRTLQPLVKWLLGPDLL